MEVQAIDAAKFGRAPPRSRPKYRTHCLEDPSTPQCFYEGDELIDHVADFFNGLFNISGEKAPIFDVFLVVDLDAFGFLDGWTLGGLILEMPLGRN